MFPHPGETLGVIVLGLGVTAVLANGMVNRWTRWLTDPPIGDLLVRSEETPAPRRRASDRPTPAAATLDPSLTRGSVPLPGTEPHATVP